MRPGSTSKAGGGVGHPPAPAPSRYCPNETLWTRPEGDGHLLFDPGRRKIFLLSPLAYQVWASVGDPRRLDELRAASEISEEELRLFVGHLIREKLVVSTQAP